MGNQSFQEVCCDISHKDISHRAPHISAAKVLQPAPCTALTGILFGRGVGHGAWSAVSDGDGQLVAAMGQRNSTHVCAILSVNSHRSTLN